MLRRSLHCVITGLGQFCLDLLDPGPDLGERHVIGRLDLGALDEQPVQLGDAHAGLLGRGRLTVRNRQVTILAHLLGHRPDRYLCFTP